MAKKSERDSRRAVAEQMRQEQARKERRRSLLILGTCVVVVLGLLGTAVFVYVKDLREENKANGTPLAELGATTSAAKCSSVTKVKATGNNNHIDPPTPRSPTRTRRRRPDRTGGTTCRAPRSAASTPSTTDPRSSGWCTASSTATRSSGTTTP